jgi:hypothetical protein
MASRVTEDEMLEFGRLYNEGLSLIGVAAKTGRSVRTVSDYLRRLGVVIRSAGGRPPSPKIFPGATFGRWTVISEAGYRPRAGRQGGFYRWILAECACGQRRELRAALLTSEGSKSCGCLCRGVVGARMRGRTGWANPSFKGAWHRDGEGYKGFSTYRPDGRRLDIKEHVLVMEQYLGRPLLPGENVHHRNGIRDDNSGVWDPANSQYGNLELWSTTQPPGQRVEDRTAWAKEWLRLYEPEALVA